MPSTSESLRSDHTPARALPKAGCDDRAVSRRAFLATSLAAGGLAAVSPVSDAAPCRAATCGAGAGAEEDRLPGDVERPGSTPHTRFAVNVEMWWTDRPFLERVRQAAELGFPAIEFWPYTGKEIETLAKLTRELGLAVTQFTAWGFTPGLNDPVNHDAFEKAIKESCDVADLLDCRLFTVVVGNIQKGMSRDEMRRAIVGGLERVAPYVADRGKTMIIEPMNPRNHPDHYLYGSAEAIRICSRIDSPAVKINWDLYHMQIVEGDLCRHLSEGFEHVGYVQLADNPGRHEPGTGEIRATRLFQELATLGYRGHVGLECRPLEGEWRAAQRVHAADRW